MIASGKHPTSRWSRGVDERCTALDAIRVLLEFRQLPRGRPDIALIPLADVALFLEVAQDTASVRARVAATLPAATVAALSEDDIIVLRAFALEGPYPIHKLLNAWMSSDRRDDELKAVVGPVVCRMLRATSKLPKVEVAAMRGVTVGNVPALVDAHAHYMMSASASQPANFWGFASFTTRSDAIEQFVRTPTSRCIVYKCSTLRGVSLAPFTDLDEAEVLVPAPSMFRVTHRTVAPDSQTLILSLEAVDATAYAYVDADPPPLDAVQGELARQNRYRYGRCADVVLEGVEPRTTYRQGAVLLTTSHTPRHRGTGYWALGRCDRPFQHPDGRTMDAKSLFLEALKHDPSQSYAYYNLSAVAGSESIRLADGRTMDERSLLIEALKYDASNSHAYVDLGAALSPGESIRLADGRTMDRTALYLEALKHSPACSPTCNALGAALSPGESIRLPDGRTMDRKAMFVEAIAHDPTNSYAYRNLGAALQAGESIHLADDRILDQKAMFLQALKHDPSNSLAYYDLGSVLSPGESIRLADGRTMDERSLLIEALKYNPCNSTAYLNLGAFLSPGESIQLPDGRTMDRTTLCVEALKHDPFNSYAYNGLSATLSAGESIQLADGRTMDDKALCVEAIKCDPFNSYAYYNLGAALSPGESTHLADGRTMDRIALFAETLKLDPSYASAYHQLSLALAPGQTIRLADGRTMDSAQLMAEASRNA